ncbi:unnamed protein product [Coffea canephora]|uniref:Uncharacterized protein n=1 Tax=Coffea canephora TaxID=49390 RepID=A0A068UBH8_COFCA|nr:unnamed protein product [Coffea canephora]
MATRERQLLRGKLCFVDLLIRKAIHMVVKGLSKTRILKYYILSTCLK